MKRLSSGFVPTIPPARITSALLKDLIVEVVKLDRERLLDLLGTSPEEIDKMLKASSWKRERKETVDKDMRSLLTNHYGVVLPDEPVYVREFRFENDVISWVLAETYATKDKVLLIHLEDQ